MFKSRKTQTPATPWMGSVALPIASPSPVPYNSRYQPPIVVPNRNSTRSTAPVVDRHHAITPTPARAHRQQSASDDEFSRPRTYSMTMPKPLKSILKRTKPVPHEYPAPEPKPWKGKEKAIDEQRGSLPIDGGMNKSWGKLKDLARPSSRAEQPIPVAVPPSSGRRASDSSNTSSSTNESTTRSRSFKITKGPLKMAVYSLSWPLQEVKEHRSKGLRKVKFDMAFDPRDPYAQNVRVRYPDYGCNLVMKDRHKSLPVCSHDMLERMFIRCPLGPREWPPITLHRPGGITCWDVFCAIYDHLNQKITTAEYREIDPDYITACHGAFLLRCKQAPGLTLKSVRDLFLRLDLLNGMRGFGGLRQLTSDTWMLVYQDLSAVYA